MASRLFVVNEWLLEDLRGTNGPEKRHESYKWLKTLHDRCDRLAVLKPSPWTQKAYRLMKQTDTTGRMVSRFLHQEVLRNQLKTQLVPPTELRQAPPEVRDATPEPDRYLVDLYFTVNAARLITTDTALHEKLAASKEVNVDMRDSFVAAYLSGSDAERGM